MFPHDAQWGPYNELLLGLLSDHSRNTDPSTYRILAGEIYLYGDQKLLSVNKIIIHPDFVNAYLGADVALLQLVKPVNSSTNVKPIKLTFLNHEVTQKDECWVTGWGQMNFYGKYWGHFLYVSSEASVAEATARLRHEFRTEHRKSLNHLYKKGFIFLKE